MKDRRRYNQATSRMADYHVSAIEADLYLHSFTRTGRTTHPATSSLIDRSQLLVRHCFLLAQRLRLWSTIVLEAAFSIIRTNFFVMRMQSCEGYLLLICNTVTFENAMHQSKEHLYASIATKKMLDICMSPQNIESSVATIRFLQGLPQRGLERART
jgi:hypothetical protein